MLKMWYWLYRWSAKSDYTVIYILGGLSVILGWAVYYCIYDLPLLESIIYGVQLLAMDVKTPFELNGTLHIAYESLIYVPALLATMTLGLGIVALIVNHNSSVQYLKNIIRNGGHTIVVGLGRNSRFFINSMLEDEEYEEHKMVVFEKEQENHHIEQYQRKPLALVTGDVENSLKDLNLNKAENIFISTGSDESNIYLAMKFLAKLDNQEHAIEKLVVHIEDRTLRNLYDDDKALLKGDIDLRHFSFYKESARILFKEHPLEGDGYEVMNSTNPFHIVIVGNGEFSISLIAEACKLSSLPNENELHIHCMGMNQEDFEQRLLYAFPNIEEIKHVHLDFIEEDSRKIDFYKHKVWGYENITHVIYADASAVENVRIATKVSDVVYLRDREKIKNTKFHIATMNSIKIAEEIQTTLKNKRAFTCAQADKVCSIKNLFCNDVDLIAKIIHYTYASNHYRNCDVKEVCDNIVNRIWREASVNDKRASTAQAININKKLKALGLARKKSEMVLDELYKHNQIMLNATLEKEMKQFGLEPHKLDQMEQAYTAYIEKKKKVDDGYFFPKAYTTRLEKMLRMEHNRWMTTLRLMDNKLDDKAKDLESQERKKLKIHHLLKPFSDFESNEEKIYIVNDFNTIKNIARYMALSGCEIVEFEI